MAKFEISYAFFFKIISDRSQFHSKNPRIYYYWKNSFEFERFKIFIFISIVQVQIITCCSNGTLITLEIKKSTANLLDAVDDLAYMLFICQNNDNILLSNWVFFFGFFLINQRITSIANNLLCYKEMRSNVLHLYTCLKSCTINRTKIDRI